MNIPDTPTDREPYGKNIARKLDEIGGVNGDIRALITDYLGNEWFCVHFSEGNMPKERISEFHTVCDMLRAKKTHEILSLLDGYAIQPGIGTNENRQFLLERMGLWAGK